jgi:hypothetical protein
MTREFGFLVAFGADSKRSNLEALHSAIIAEGRDWELSNGEKELRIADCGLRIAE